MSGWQCEPLNPKPPKPSAFEHVRLGTFTRADVGAKWVGTAGNVSGRPKPLEQCAVWDNLKRFRSSQTTREVSSLTACRAVWDNLETFQVVPNHSRSVLADNLSNTFQVVPNHSRSVLADDLSSGLGQPETFQVVPNHSSSVLADDLLSSLRQPEHLRSVLADRRWKGVGTS